MGCKCHHKVTKINLFGNKQNDHFLFCVQFGVNQYRTMQHCQFKTDRGLKFQVEF